MMLVLTLSWRDYFLVILIMTRGAFLLGSPRSLRLTKVLRRAGRQWPEEAITSINLSRHRRAGLAGPKHQL